MAAAAAGCWSALICCSPEVQMASRRRKYGFLIRLPPEALIASTTAWSIVSRST